MSVTVISRRVFKIDRKELIPLLSELRRLAEKQKGFISRASYTNVKAGAECITISKWESKKQWQNWMNKKKVQKIQWEIDSLLGEKTVFDVYKKAKF